MNLIDVQQLTFAYFKDETVLEDLDLAVEEGSIVGLIGRNGSGKTTLFRLLLGLYRAQSGTIRVLDRDPFGQALEVKKRLGYVAENQILPEALTSEEIVDLHEALFPTWNQSLARSLERRLEIPKGKPLARMSKGMQRRVALLCALAHEPELLLLDEPGGGLDLVARKEFLELSVEYASESGGTILFSSHHLGDVGRISDRLLLLDRGRIRFAGSADQLREDYSRVFFPKAGQRALDEMQDLPSCLRAFPRGEGVQVVFRGKPEEIQNLLAHRIAAGQALVESVDLEGFFLDMVGRG